ncbi:hypothetical protein sortkaff_16 [Escherichia phage sortkaff]|uniref:Uncharacterized protein n=1 Tax=Escherichia phage sortkaff TaxID=2696445 RepID=A0A6C0R295_9CAUD|nr:hypothetical protein sortkaff_16 [Escherichia phage sortkaff]
MFIAVKKHNRPVFLNVNEIKIIRDAEPDIHNPDYDPKIHPGSVIFTTTDQHSTLERYFSSMSPEDLRDVINDAAAQVYAAPIAARIMSLDNCVARLARSMEDWLELANTPIINGEDLDVQRILDETKQTLDSIQPRLVAGGSPGKPRHFVGLDSDVFNVVQLLTSHEWADHCTSTQLGQRLESAITDLHNHTSEIRQRKDRAEELLAEVWHEWNNDDATRKALGEDMGKVIGNFLWPDENKTCEKE